MRCVTLVVLLAVAGCATPPGTPTGNGPSPQLYAFITHVADEAFLNLRITNRGDTPLTVPTGSPALWSTDFPVVGLRFDILTLESPGEAWRFIPSVTDVSPVLLRTGDTATMSVKLTGKKWLPTGGSGEGLVTVQYAVGKELADRFGLWTGTIVIRKSLDSLRSE